jgi:hypothetical protein
MRHREKVAAEKAAAERAAAEKAARLPADWPLSVPEAEFEKDCGLSKGAPALGIHTLISRPLPSLPSDIKGGAARRGPGEYAKRTPAQQDKLRKRAQRKALARPTAPRGRSAGAIRTPLGYNCRGGSPRGIITSRRPIGP